MKDVKIHLTPLQVTHVMKACRLYRKKAERDVDPTFVPMPGKKNSQIAKMEIMDDVLKIFDEALKKRVDKTVQAL